MFEKRDIVVMVVLTIITLGFYKIYWLVKTKGEFNKLGAQIPTAWLLIIPFANLYFLFRWSQGFCKYVTKSNEPIVYFLLLLFLPFISMYILQYYINHADSTKEIG